jgi:hypothetical protein
MSKYDQVRKELAEGPATAYELGVALGWVEEHGCRRGMRLASAWCANLLWRGHVKHVAQVRQSNGHLSWLYELTPKGRARLPS